MELKIDVLVTNVFDIREGQTERGTWKSRDFMAESDERYPHKLYFEIFGADKVDKFPVQIGRKYSVYFDIDSQPFNGKYYTHLKVWKIEPLGVQQAQQPMPQTQQAMLQQTQQAMPQQMQQPIPQQAQQAMPQQMQQQATIPMPQGSQQISTDLPF